MPSTIPCAVCGDPMQQGSTSAREGVATHRRCNGPKFSRSRHGVSAYRRGCRCQECRAAKAAYQRDLTRRREEEGRPIRVSPETRAKSRAKSKTSYSYTEQMRQRDAIRRARKAGATVESFTYAEVFERDGWSCGICGGPTDRLAKFPDPAMPSLDHIQPLSLGGEHSRSNTRCAHLGCNIKRGNRVAA